jgi:hypothetical protein
MLRKIFGSRHRPRRRRPVRPPLTVEVLESRTLLAAAILGPTELVQGQPAEFQLIDDSGGVSLLGNAGIIHELIGDQSFAPLSVGLDSPGNAINVDGMLHITGFSDGIGALQIIDLTTGVAGPIQQFHSLNGLGGRAVVDEIIVTNDGRIVYVGASALGATFESATYWVNGVDSRVP